MSNLRCQRLLRHGQDSTSRLFTADRPIERIYHCLHLDEFVSRAFGLVAVERRGKHFGMRVALFQHSIPRFFRVSSRSVISGLQ